MGPDQVGYQLTCAHYHTVVHAQESLSLILVESTPTAIQICEVYEKIMMATTIT